MAGLDAKVFGIKDVITILIISGGFFTQWYTMDARVGTLENEKTILQTEVADLKEANKAYASLPKDMTQMQIDIEKNGKTITAVYYGLLANGTIKPPQ